MQYSGRLTTFSNNEPLLDDRIIEFNKYAKEHLPKARIHMYTNGTLFTPDKFKELVEALYKGRQYCGDCRLCDTFSMG